MNDPSQTSPHPIVVYASSFCFVVLSPQHEVNNNNNNNNNEKTPTVTKRITCIQTLHRIALLIPFFFQIFVLSQCSLIHTVEYV